MPFIMGMIFIQSPRPKSLMLILLPLQKNALQSQNSQFWHYLRSVEFRTFSTTGCDLKEAKNSSKLILHNISKVKEYLQHSIALVKETSKATTIAGRIRPIPEIHSKNASLRGKLNVSYQYSFARLSSRYH